MRGTIEYTGDTITVKNMLSKISNGQIKLISEDNSTMITPRIGDDIDDMLEYTSSLIDEMRANGENDTASLAFRRKLIDFHNMLYDEMPTDTLG
ncbi:MAG: hypothetical protein LBR36_05340 [Bacteroidales bacterium]|jgi:hypothetical protein|nr:hypothetical protein [Bacteroidales bacterium]